MLQKEFEDRTGIKVSLKEYSAIEEVYMESDLDKNEFCKMWCKMNTGRIKAAKKELAEKEAKETTRLLYIITKIDRKRQKVRYNFMEEPLSVHFLSESEIRFLQKCGIKMNISIQEAVDFGYPVPRHYRISETAYHIKKYLKIV